MLKRFWVNNFRSLLNFEFKPVGLNLLIGKNNAGKTNLCAALHFLKLTASMSLEDALRAAVGETWNIPNVDISDNTTQLELDCTLNSDGTALNFNYRLEFKSRKSESSNTPVASVVSETLSVKGGRFINVDLIQNDGRKVRLFREGDYEDSETGRHKGDVDYIYNSSDKTALLTPNPAVYSPTTDLFRGYLQSWGYYNLNSQDLRSRKRQRDAPGLLSTGCNLGRTFYSLHNERPRIEKKLIEAVRLLEPKLDLFSYISPDPESVYLFMEDAEGHRFGIQSLSDGTLRFMAMAYLIHAAADKSNGSGPSPLVIIEEPENGLYVGHLKPLVQSIDPRGKAGQFIFTSHNPYFIDLFDDNLEGIHIIKPGRPSSVLVKPDATKVRSLLEEMPLGELHFRDLLG
jgi:predicted ATPase